jgi:hypothetical protein
MKKVRIRYSEFSRLSCGEVIDKWDDVWISFFVGKRKKKYFAPCVLTKKQIDWEIDGCENLNQFAFDKDFLQKCYKIKNDFVDGVKYGVLEGIENMPDVYFNKDVITRKDVEEFVASHFNFKKVKFKWDKR